MAEIQFDGFQLLFPIKSPNKMYSPDGYNRIYDTLQDAYDTVPEELRVIGRQVGLKRIDGKGVDVYVFELDSNDDWILVPFGSGGGGGDDWGNQVVESDSTLTGSGTILDKLSLADGAVTSIKLNQMGATTGQVLVWDGAQWIPDDQSGGGGSDDWGNQVVESDSTLDGDGTIGNELKLADGAVTAIKINQMGATTNQVLKWNGATWEPSNEDGDTGWGTQIVETDITLEGDGTIINPLGIADDGVTTSKIKTLAVTTNKISTNAIVTSKINNGAVTSEKLNQMGATVGQILKWNGSAWIASNDESSGDNWGTQVVETDDSLSGDGTSSDKLSIATYGVTNIKIQNEAVTNSKIKDKTITAIKLDQMGATVGQILKWNGATWEVADELVGNNDWGTQVVESDSTLDGDGTVVNPLGLADDAVTTLKILDRAVTGDKIAQMGAGEGEVMAWDGTNWVPTEISVETPTWQEVIDKSIAESGTGAVGAVFSQGESIGVYSKAITFAGTLKNFNYNSLEAGSEFRIALYAYYRMNFKEGKGLKIEYSGTPSAGKILVTDAEGYLQYENKPVFTTPTWQQVIDAQYVGATTSLIANFRSGAYINDSDDNFILASIQAIITSKNFANVLFAANDYLRIWINGNAGVAGQVLLTDGTDNYYGDITVNTEASIDGDGSATAPLKLAQMGATDGQILKWDNANGLWVAADEDSGGGGPDDWGSQVVEKDYSLTGDGTNSQPLGLSQMGAVEGQILSWNETSTKWEPTEFPDYANELDLLTPDI